MGGFARYPWPKFLANAPFYYNPQYKRAMVCTGIACLVNIMWFHRLLYGHMVICIKRRPKTLDTVATSTLNTLKPPRKSN
jgi:hypothetical protein